MRLTRNGIGLVLLPGLVLTWACSCASGSSGALAGPQSDASPDAGVPAADATDTTDATDATTDPATDRVHQPTIDGTCVDDYDCREEQHCFGGFCVDDVGYLQFGNEEEEKIDDLAVDSADNVVVTGYSVLTSGGGANITETFYVSKYSATGERIWTQTAPIRTMMTRTNHLVLDSQDNVYVAGTTYSDFDGRGVWDGVHADAFIIKFDSDGEEKWRWQQIDADVSEHARGIAIDEQGRIYVVGDLINNRQFVAEVDPEGSLIRTHGFGNPNTLSSATDILCAGGNIYISGTDDNNAFVTKLDASFKELWREEWKSTNAQRDVAQALILGEPGVLFVAGNSSVEDPSQDPGSNICGDNGCHDIFLTKVVEAGQGENAIASVKWTAYLSMFPTADFAHDLTLNDGRILVAGSVETDAFLAPFHTNAAWRGPVACDEQDCAPRLFTSNGAESPAGELGLPGDFFLNQSGGAPKLYNKKGAVWDVVAASQGGQVALLHQGAGAPEDGIGALGDFFVDTADNSIYERAVYDRTGFRFFSSGDDPSLVFDPTDFSESAQAIASDSQGNIWVGGHTYGDFSNFENPSSNHGFADGLLIKIFR